MDHVEAQVMKRDKSGVIFRITNPTKYDASISIFAETLADSKEALPMNAFSKWPKVEVKAGETQMVTITMNGQLKSKYNYSGGKGISDCN
jgi:hypothetical protein